MSMTTNAAESIFAAQQELVTRLDESGWDLIVGDALRPGHVSQLILGACTWLAP